MYQNLKPENVNGIKVPYDLDESALITLLENPKTKWAAFTALGYKDSDTSLQLLIEYYNSKDLYNRIAALKAIADHSKGSQAEKVFSHALADENPHIVTNACLAVSQLGLMLFHDTVAKLIDSNNFSIREEAIRAIGSLWQESDLAKMVHILNKENDLCRKIAADNLRRHANSINWFEIFKLLSEAEHPPRFRVYACDIALEYGNEKAINILLKLSKDADGHVRKHAAKALDRITRS